MDEMIDVPIHLTREHIDQLTECPVALAARIAMPGAMITTSATRMRIDASGRSVAIPLPFDARNVISALSHDFAVTPRTLVIPIPRSIAETPGFLADETLLAPLALEAMPL